jgi:hypothetical protein
VDARGGGRRHVAAGAAGANRDGANRLRVWMGQPIWAAMSSRERCQVRYSRRSQDGSR